MQKWQELEVELVKVWVEMEVLLVSKVRVEEELCFISEKFKQRLEVEVGWFCELVEEVVCLCVLVEEVKWQWQLVEEDVVWQWVEVEWVFVEKLVVIGEVMWFKMEVEIVFKEKEVENECLWWLVEDEVFQWWWLEEQVV